MPFTFTRLKLPEVILIEPKVFKDKRGLFLETYQLDAFKNFGIKEDFVQDNMSWSRKGVLRGMHFQKEPHGQGKLVSVKVGKVFDVAVDIRKESPTYGKWVGEILSDENHHMLYIPPDFAHGFVALSENVCFTYKVTHNYSPESEKGFIWDDPDVNIDWPIDESPFVNEKDLKLPRLKDLK